MRRDPTTVAAIAAIAALLHGGDARSTKLLPEHGAPPVAVEVAGSVYAYYPLEPGRPLVFEVEGPARFEAIARWRFADVEAAPADVEVELALDGVGAVHEIFRARPGSAGYPDLPGSAASRARRLTVEVPPGRHRVEMRLVSPAAGALDVNALATRSLVPRRRLALRLAAGIDYDSNVFRYSDEDVDDFLDGLKPERFPIESLDDVRLTPSVGLGFLRDEPGVGSSEIRLTGEGRLAVVNGEKSFGKVTVLARERRDHVARLTAEYSLIPRYVIRSLWDDDASEYRECSFRKDAFLIEMGSDRALAVDVAGVCKYEVYRYGRAFIEYDAEARTIGARATVRPARGLRVDAAYAVKDLDARASDEPGETAWTSDDADASYDQDEYSIRARWEAGEMWGRPAVLTLRARNARRYYSTPRSGAQDPYHAGRRDSFWTVGMRLGLDLGPRSRVEGFVEYRTRSARSHYVADLGDLKDYSAWRAGLTFFTEGVRFLD